jgi:hypothetical protein
MQLEALRKLRDSELERAIVIHGPVVTAQRTNALVRGCDSQLDRLHSQRCV